MNDHSLPMCKAPSRAWKARIRNPGPFLSSIHWRWMSHFTRLFSSAIVKGLPVKKEWLPSYPIQFKSFPLSSTSTSPDQPSDAEVLVKLWSNQTMFSKLNYTFDIFHLREKRKSKTKKTMHWYLYSLISYLYRWLCSFLALDTADAQGVSLVEWG